MESHSHEIFDSIYQSQAFVWRTGHVNSLQPKTITHPAPPTKNNKLQQWQLLLVQFLSPHPLPFVVAQVFGAIIFSLTRGGAAVSPRHYFRRVFFVYFRLESSSNRVESDQHAPLPSYTHNFLLPCLPPYFPNFFPLNHLISSSLLFV